MHTLKYVAVSLLAASIAPNSASSQAFPSRPITMIVPLAAGGPTDTLARIVAEGMMESLGQQLNGLVQLAYEPSGFRYALDVPLGSVIAAG